MQLAAVIACIDLLEFTERRKPTYVYLLRPTASYNLWQPPHRLLATP